MYSIEYMISNRRCSNVHISGPAVPVDVVQGSFGAAAGTVAFGRGLSFVYWDWEEADRDGLFYHRLTNNI